MTIRLDYVMMLSMYPLFPQLYAQIINMVINVLCQDLSSICSFWWLMAYGV